MGRRGAGVWRHEGEKPPAVRKLRRPHKAILPPLSKAGALGGAEAGAGGVSVMAAMMLWLVLLGVFLVVIPGVFRRRRARSGQRSD